ncbi:hypothetical protein F4805DRAFT_477116 [Annulohypoxylon moriforme]|nr:hypothetical protein F4805DRAFT_477116 [Annulohypoxylon moriforme]
MANQGQGDSTPVSYRTFLRYEDEELESFQARMERLFHPRPDLPRNYSHNSNAEAHQAETRPGGQLPRSSSYAGPFVPYRPGARWPTTTNQEDASRAPNEQTPRQGESQTRPHLTVDTVRWPFLDDDEDDEESDHPNSEFPAVPLADAPLRRRRAIRQSPLKRQEGRLPPSPTGDGHDNVVSPLSQVRRDPLSHRIDRWRWDVHDSSIQSDRERSWSPGDDEQMDFKTALEISPPSSQE